MARNTEIKSKLALKDVGDASAVTKSDKDVLPLARLYGVVSGVVVRNTPTGDRYEGAKGSFRIVPVDETKPVLSSHVLYLPDAVQSIITDKIKNDKGETTGESVQFAYDIGGKKTADGWTWNFEPVVVPEVFDPLADLIASVEEPAPGTATGKSGKK